MEGAEPRLLIVKLVPAELWELRVGAPKSTAESLLSRAGATEDTVREDPIEGDAKGTGTGDVIDEVGEIPIAETVAGAQGATEDTEELFKNCVAGFPVESTATTFTGLLLRDPDLGFTMSISSSTSTSSATAVVSGSW